MLSFDTFRQDLRYALRVLSQSLAFSLVAVLTLAIGIGATSALFTQLNAVFFKPLPVWKPSELRALAWTSPIRSQKNPNFPTTSGFSEDAYIALKERTSFADVACTWGFPRNLIAESGPVSVQFVSGNYFKTLGVPAILGRTIAPEDDQPGNPAFVAVIGYRLWRRAFQSDSDVLNRRLTLNGTSFQIIGVLPEGFAGMNPTDPREVIVPYALRPFFLEQQRIKPDAWGACNVVARLQTGVSEGRYLSRRKRG